MANMKATTYQKQVESWLMAGDASSTTSPQDSRGRPSGGDVIISPRGYDNFQDDDEEREQFKLETIMHPTELVQEVRTKVPIYVPALNWIKSYNKDDAIGDLLAGITVAVMLVPQGLAYAFLAGLPAVYGLYTGFTPLLVYAFMGNTKQLAVGPEAMLAVLIGSMLEKFETEEELIEAAHSLALLVGVLSFAFGVFQFGFLHNILSRWVLAGFVNAVAAIIALSQLDSITGVKMGELESYEKIPHLLGHLDEVKGYTLLIGVISIIWLFGVQFIKRKLSKKFPYARYFPEILVVVLFGILVAGINNLDEHGVAIVGDVAAGFPTPKAPHMSLVLLGELLPDALLLTIIGFVEATAVSKNLATRHNYKVSANRERVAFGVANFVGSFFQCYPAFASIPRTHIQDMAGSRTCMTGALVAILMLITIQFLTPLFYYMPKVTMGAIIMNAAFGLIEVHEYHFLKQAKAWKDLALFFGSMIATFFLGPELGIVLSVGVCLFLVIKHTVSPHIYAVLGRMPGTKKLKDISLCPEAKPFEKVLFIRIEEALYFANIGQIKELIETVEKLKAKQNVGVEIIALNCRNTQLDASAVMAFTEMAESYQTRKVKMVFVQLTPAAKQLFDLGGLTALIGEQSIFEKNEDFLAYLEREHGIVINETAENLAAQSSSSDINLTVTTGSSNDGGSVSPKQSPTPTQRGLLDDNDTNNDFNNRRGNGFTTIQLH